ncbi:MAG: tRNA lysidine(34) synthetase TilS [Chloroflexi bacterium]|nr:tRNA lysidine(34) synthetase TilS [Chloroflexota bacterium]
MLQHTKEALRQLSPLDHAAPLLVGVSGGQDSVCLLHVLWRLAPELSIRLVVAHLNHGLRGEQGAADAAFVRALCQELAVPCVVERRDVTGYLESHASVSSVEEAAREVRYAFFAQAAQGCGASTVAVGHTADDQVETVLLHLIRGSGLQGLGGMDSVGVWQDPASGQRLRVIRPLLTARRSETEAYCSAHGLHFRTDISNLSAHLSRNRLRLETLPQLRKINPGVDQALLRLAQHAQEEERYWRRAVAAVWPDVGEERPSTLRQAQDTAGSGHRPNGVALRVAQMRALPPPLAKRVLQEAYGRLVPGARGLEAVHLDALLGLVVGPRGRALHLGQGVLAERAGGVIELRRRVIAGSCGVPAAPVPLAVPGQTRWSGWVITARLCEGAVLPRPGNPLQAHLDYRQTGQRLLVRGRRPGDRVHPLGLGGSKKLQDLLVDGRVPRSSRDAVPLIEAGDRVAWVGGLRVCEPFQVTEATTTTLALELAPEGEEARRFLQFCDSVHYNWPASDAP